MSAIFHLSHTDLDGYGCQYFTAQCFSDISFYNANYGPEVTAMLESILAKIQARDCKDVTILITDLNLTPKESRWIEEQTSKLGITLQLLDHHASGQSCFENFAWYYLDTTRSASQITYDWLQQHYSFDPSNSFLKTAQVINSVDIWLSNHPYFELGKVALSMVSSTKELNKVMFDSSDRAFKLYLVEQINAFIDRENAHIAFDDAMHKIKKEFFKNAQNDTKDNLVASYVVALIGTQKERLTIECEGKKGVLVYGVGNSSIIGNRFLLENEDYDFYMDISGRGTFSMRSANRVDVAQLAQKIGNGGGHPNASGGKIENFKNSFIYEEIKAFVEEHIENVSKKI